MAYCCVVDCNNYSDLDVYYVNGSSKEMCSNHAGELAFDNPEVMQVVPQHGGPMNQPREKGYNAP